MSTSFILASAALEETADTPGDADDTANVNIVRKMLCKPVSYDTGQHIIYNRHFLKDQVIISMRLLSLSTDLPVIYNWLPWEYTRHLKKEAHVEQLHEIYSRIAGSGTAQSFMVLMNNTNLAQADIYQATADDISLQYNVKAGDYKLQLLIKPERLLIGNYSLCAIQATLGFLFSFQEVKRVVMQLDENEFLNSKMEKAGFIFHKKTSTRQKTARLYTCTRESLRDQGEPPSEVDAPLR
ncbi:GNAT family N-acetyltransferase [Paraflavitalea soli]|uniref:GNAT family N-acetyltransferase n=1 Tax=Paraflavitalea soli TaxID=2315862 RepID=A0A3B7MNM4_9BACT|nr:GNAT family N-acetyltransferase [Paraflavitalea soli]AXY76092.1 GNAT family N-acetyltransferase [Paraflavitalea soli]